MPDLSDATLLRLASYTKSRDGEPVPSTISGNVFENACWSWALSGGSLGVNDPTSPFTITNSICTYDPFTSDPPTAMLPNLANLYPGSEAEIEAMNEQFGAAVAAGANYGADASQAIFFRAYVRLVLRANGFTLLNSPVGAKYGIAVRSSNWWNTDHWAIRLFQPGDAMTTFVQTVTGTPLMFSCDRVWDEGLKGAVVGVQELKQSQVTQLSAVPWSTCRAWNRNLKGQTFRCWGALKAGAGQCSQCGFVCCADHLGSRDLMNAFIWGQKVNDVYKCQACGGDVAVLA